MWLACGLQSPRCMKCSYLLAALITATSSLACDKAPTGAGEKPTAATPSAAATTDAAALSATITAYDGLRAALAEDDAAKAATSARALATAAQAATAKAASQKSTLEALAKHAKEISGNDIEAQRTAFGEVSRQLVTLLAARPALQKGHHVYTCPMAKGYKKWVQTTDKMANPYMGKKMLHCGSASDWSM